ncbi:MAG: TetR/AcrR family transcriptional regulator [Bacteroidota bacterium]
MPKIVAQKQDWIELGYQRFSESGVAGINVDRMSATLKCNKSSFYWHFKSKKDFIDGLVQYWMETDTQAIIDQVNAQPTAKDQFLKLVELSFKKDAHLDFVFYLKKYAQSRKEIKAIVAGIDVERIVYVRALLQGMGHSEDQAAIKANIFYRYLIGYHETIRYETQPKNYLSEVIRELKHFIPLLDHET